MPAVEASTPPPPPGRLCLGSLGTEWTELGKPYGPGCSRSTLGCTESSPTVLSVYHHCGPGDGRATSFWYDHWQGSGSLATAFPCIASHVTAPGASVQETVEKGIHRQLAPRLSRQAREELEQIQAILMGVVLTDSPDKRLCPLLTGNQELTKMCTSNLDHAPQC
jgi:hypothetical protein